MGDDCLVIVFNACLKLLRGVYGVRNEVLGDGTNVVFFPNK
jgi:hypothetical protein